MSSEVAYRVAADMLLLVHTAFVVFVVLGLVLVVLGGLLAWGWVRNPWFRLAHLASIVFVVVQQWAGQICPLTIWEMTLRQRAGDASYAGSFVAHWLETLLYYQAPPWVFTVAYTVFAVLVVGGFFWVRPRSFRHTDLKGKSG